MTQAMYVKPKPPAVKPADGEERGGEDYYLCEVLGAAAGAVVAHDRGDSVALAFAARCATGESSFDLRQVVLSNGNMFLPLSNLTIFQRLVLDPDSAPQVLEALTPELLAAGMGEHTFTPPRSLERRRCRAARRTVPGPVSPAPGAPILIDRSRASMPSATEVLAGA